MKKLIQIVLFVLSLGINTNTTFSQTMIEENSPARLRLNGMFSHFNKEGAPTGLLKDFAIEYIELDNYNGTILADSTCVDVMVFEDILKTIRSSAVSEEKPFYEVSVIMQDFKECLEPPTVNIATCLFRYNYIRADALERGNIRYANGCVLNGSGYPFGESDVFAFTPDVGECKSMGVDYVFFEDYMFQNIGNVQYAFDAGDGNGFYGIQPGDSINVHYTEEGEKELRMVALLPDGTELISHSKIVIVDPANNTQLGVSNGDKLPSMPFETDFNGVAVSALMSYSCKSADGKFRKPFIIVEGFDPWELMGLMSVNASYEPDKLGFLSYGSLWPYFQNSDLYNDYDFVYIDWYNSTDDIRANAQLLTEIIEHINANAENGKIEDGILMGQSMGGLVARYALRKMEILNKPHGITTFVSHDAPHLGANVPIGAQYFIQQLFSLLHGYTGFVSANQMAKMPFDFESAILSVLHSTAAQQMLCNYINKDGELDNTVHNEWLEELQDIGFPQGDYGKNIECLSVVNGKASDYSMFLTEQGNYLHLEGNARIATLVSLLAPVFWNGTYVGYDFSFIKPFLRGFGAKCFEIEGDINPVVSSTYGQAASSLKVLYQKKFLWWPISSQIAIFDTAKYAPCLSLYPEEATGSTYELSDEKIEAELQGEIVGGIAATYSVSLTAADKIIFVPNASALNIKNGATNNADYIKNYYYNPPTPKEETPFDSYFMCDSLRHIDCDEHVFDWIYKQANMKIEGADFIWSNGTSDYTITGYEGNVEWSTSDSNIATIDASGRLTANNFGAVTVVAQVPYANGKLYRKNKYVSIGFPDMVITKSFEIGLGYKFVASTTDSNMQANLNQIVNDGTLQYEWSVIDSEGNMTTYLSSNNYLVYLPDIDEAVTVCVRLVETGTENKSAVKSTSFNLQTLFDLNYDYAAIGADGFAYLVNIEQNTLDGEAQETAVRFNYGTKLRISLKNVSLDSTTNSNTTESLTEMLNTYIKGNVCYLKYGDAWMSNYLTGTKVSLYNKWDFDFFDHDIFLDEVAEVVSEANGEDRVLATIPLIICNSEYENLQFVPFHIVYKSSIGQD